MIKAKCRSDGFALADKLSPDVSAVSALVEDYTGIGKIIDLMCISAYTLRTLLSLSGYSEAFLYF